MSKYFILLFALTLNYSSYGTLPSWLPSNGLIAWYPFNGNANDESGNNFNGIGSNVVSTTDRFGVANAAYSFNGINSRINVPAAFFDIGAPEFTISCWMNSDNANNSNNPNFSQPIINTVGHHGVAISTYGSNNPFTDAWDNKYVLLVGLDPNNTQWDIVVGTSNSNRSLNQWNHVVLVKNGSLYSLYINGVLDNTFAGSMTAYDAFCGLVFGALDPAIPAEVFSGKLDDFAIWSRAITPTEIQQIYNSGNVVSVPTMNEWGMISLTILMLLFGVCFIIYKNF